MLFLLLCAYAICFGIQHKIGFLHGKTDFTDKLLACTYCTGFHAGWITYLLNQGSSCLQNGKFDVNLLDLVLFAFASSIFAYVSDTLVRVMETYAD